MAYRQEELLPESIIVSPLLSPSTYTNPVLNHDFPDPDVLCIDQVYYAYATNSGGINVQAAQSRDLVHWTLLPEILPERPRWAASEFGWTWAPNVMPTDHGTGYVMYFSNRLARDIKGRSHCMGIGVAESNRPEGPFIPQNEILICQIEEGGSIDLASFIDDDGSRYLVWKNDGNSCNMQTWIFIQQVAADGMTRLGRPRRLITADQPWEGCLVEAPTLWKHDGLYYLFYSANYFMGPEYGIGYAVAEAPLGPYRKARRPLLTTRHHEGLTGPGGQDLVRTPDGKTWMLFHAWGEQNCRVLHLAEVIWECGRPTLRGAGLQGWTLP